MKRNGTLFLLMAFRAILLAQTNGQVELLLTDSTWKKEVFQFPLSFAPDIPFQGVEEARFPKYWADTSSAESWSYVFAWEIARQSAFTESQLEDNLQQYFNGLMGWEQTTALFLKTADRDGASYYIGKIKTFDAFFSRKTMTLHAMVTCHYCSQRKSAIVFFRFSPKGFEHEIWHKLNGVTLLLPKCEP